LVLAAAILLAGWFGLLAWLAHSPRDFPLAWQGLWAGDRRNHPRLLLAAEKWFQNTTETGVSHPATPLTDEANPAYKLARGEGIFLGRWLPQDVHRWTLSFWVRMNAGTNAAGFIPLAGGMDRGQNLPWCWGLTNGVAAFQLRYEDRKFTVDTGKRPPPGEWVQLTAVYAMPHLRLYVNGQPAGTQFSSNPLRLAREVWLGSPAGTRPARPSFALDDFAVFVRALSAEEVTAWHAAGRGAPMKFLERRAWRDRLGQRGTPWMLALATLLGGLAVLPWLRDQVFGGLRELRSPPLRAVRWTLLAGTTVTVVLVMVVARAGRQADELNLKLITETFRQSADSYLERMADLLGRLRDQVTASTNVTPAQFRSWLAASNFPHDQPGLYAVGLALRAETETLADLERSWAGRYRSNFVVTPRLPDEERTRWRGWPAPPRLPVVIHVVNDWGSVSGADRTQLGLDLAAVRADDEDIGGQLDTIQASTRDSSIRSCGLVEISGAEFGGAARTGIRLFTGLHRPPSAGQPLNGLRDWAGVVFASLDLRHWLQSYFHQQAPLVGVRLVTGSTGSGFNSRDAVAADLGDFFPERARPAQPYLEREVILKVYGRRIWAQFWTTPAFAAQSHRRWPWITAGVGGLVTVLTAGLLAVQVRARLRQESVTAELRTALDELDAARCERERLSHDLHDGTIQSLYALQLGLSRAADQAVEAAPTLGTRLVGCRRNLTAIIGELRGYILRHEADEGAQGDLAGVLTALVERLRSTTETELQAEVSAEAARRLSGAQAVHLANLAREALSNALRHAHAGRITVTLRDEPDRVTLEIADDGCGFDPAAPPHTGVGLTSMRKRAAEAGGELRVSSSADKGTQVRVTVPQLEA